MQNDKNAKRYERNGNIQGQSPLHISLTTLNNNNNNVVISHSNANSVINNPAPLAHHHASFWSAYNVETGEMMSNKPKVIDNHFNDQTKYVNVSAEEALEKAQKTIDALQKKVEKLEKQQSTENSSSWSCTIL